MEFWSALEEAREGVEKGSVPDVQAAIEHAVQACRTDENFRDDRLQLIQKYIDLFDLDIAPPFQGDFSQSLDDYVSRTRPGVSLVTCCRNRNENLVKALPTWIACGEISEIIIVDWSSDAPVRDSIAASGISDPRIKVVRVDNETRWILSYAFNVGFRAASHDRILKADADILLDAAFFDKNQLAPGSFIAGDWRLAADGQEFTNGFFYCFRKDVLGVNGFNEFITTYGWDDDDIYDRLVTHGVRRAPVDPGTVYHLPHSDEERLETEALAPASAAEEFDALPMMKIQANRFVAFIMPYWNTDRALQPFDIRMTEPGLLQALRRAVPPHQVPAGVTEDSLFYARTTLLSWKHGHRPFELTREMLDRLLNTASQLDAINRVSIELALSGQDQALSRTGNYLIVALDEAGAAAADIPALVTRLTGLAAQNGLVPVCIKDDLADAVAQGLTGAGIPVLPRWCDLGHRDRVSVAQLEAGECQSGGPGICFGLTLDAAAMAGPGQDMTAAGAVATPAVQVAPGRIFVDAQHGLGNRLRAIGSAAAIAQASGRELVIVWQPDAHCEGEFGDLYDYDGAVVNECFLDSAAQDGCRVYNYMEVEEGAEKSAPILLDDGQDIYVRSAYVLNHALSDWDSENRFLRGLRPVAEIRDLVGRVRTPNALSAHIRMVGGTDYEHLAYEATDNWTSEGHAETDFWRRKSHFSHFMARIDQLIGEGRADTLFVAADKPETYAEFKARYGDRLAFLSRDLYDRSAEQLRYALADALLLGSAPLLLGSSWSSFSELAMRLSPQKMEIEMSGKDF